MDPFQLPVYQQKTRILDALSRSRVAVVESPTGSGKTTQIPQILLEAGFGGDGLIGVTQPRRIAAVSVAEFIARQRGTSIHPGTNVGVGKDYTLFALIDGVVAFERKGKTRKKVSVYPAGISEN